MDTLTFVMRGGKKLYCFIEVCETLFWFVSKSTVRLWIKKLDIQTIYPTLREKRVFKESNPKLKCSIFGLIDEDDVKRLMSDKMQGKRGKVAVTSSPAPSVSSPMKSNCDLIECLQTSRPSYSPIGGPASLNSSLEDVVQLSPPMKSNCVSSESLPTKAGPSGSPKNGPEDLVQLSPPMKSNCVSSESLPTTAGPSGLPKNGLEDVAQLSPPMESNCVSSESLPTTAGPSRLPKNGLEDVVQLSPPMKSNCASSESLPTTAGPSGSPNTGLENVVKISPPSRPSCWPISPLASVSSVKSPNQPASAEVSSDNNDDDRLGPSPKRSAYRLSKEEAGDMVNQDVLNLRKFYIVELNAERNGPPFAQATVEKSIERMYCFLYFCKHIKKVGVLSLDLFNNNAIISEYVDYLSKVRKLMPNTINAHLTAIINVIKYNFREDWSAVNTSKAIMSCRAFQRQLSRQARMIAKRSKEGLCMKKRSQEFYFNHILDTLRNLRSKIFETAGIQKARHLHDFVMLATYLRVNPGRSKEIRTLQVFVETEENQFDACLFLQENVIVFKADTTVCLIENDFKTVQSTGPRNFDLSEDRELLYYLHEYNSARPALLHAKSHAHFFLNNSGDPFKTSSSLCKYLGNLFEREVSIRVSTNALRHSIVTYFTTLDESKDVNVRESLATLMKHSVRYQQDTYNDATSQRKTQTGRELLRTKLAPEIFGKVDVIDLENEPKLGDSNVVLRPHVGDICALLDPAATADNICFFLAKVARFTSDQREAHLMHLAPLQGSETLFRLVPGKVWKEGVDSLLYPIDVLYNESEQAYELRTRPVDIYRMVQEQ